MNSATSTWPAIARLFDARSAHALSGLLQMEGIPAAVAPATVKSTGATMWQVQVCPEQLDVALLLFEKSGFTDAELSYLATGLLDGESDG